MRKLANEDKPQVVTAWQRYIQYTLNCIIYSVYVFMEKYGVVVLSNGVAQVGVLLPNSSSGGSMKQCLPSSPHVDLSCQEWMW